MLVAIIHEVAFSPSAFGKSCPICVVTFLFRPLLRSVEAELSPARVRPRSAMVQSNVNSSEAQQSHEPQSSQKIGKSRRHRRPKSKRREILAESPPPEASTSVSTEQQKPWQWVSITEPPTSKHPPVFTKDGRCVITRLNGFRCPDIF
jgi:hypothetical protein